MIIVLESQFELIFCLLSSPNCDLCKVEKAVFQGLRNLIFDLSLLILNFDLWPLKFLTRISKSKVKVQISNPRYTAFSTLRKSKVFHGMALHSFYAYWLAQNANCVRLKKRCFRGFEIWTLTCDFETWVKIFKVQGQKWKVKGQISKHLKHLFLNLTQDAFGLVRRQKMSSKWISIPWNIAFSDTRKAHFVLL